VHLVTQIRNRDAILRAGLVEGRDFTAIDSEAVARPLWTLAEKLRMGEGKGWTTLQAFNALIYPWFEHLIWKEFGNAIKAGEFDLVHRITPLSPTITSPIAKKVVKAGVPFVLGPLNGGVPWPSQFDAERRAEKEWLSYLRSAYKHLPGRASTLKHAATIIVGSRHTQSEVPAKHQGKTVYMPENGIDPARFNLASEPDGGVLRATFVGRLVPYKGADMLIEAAADLIGSGRMTLDIIGDGPMLDQLTEQANSLGCEKGLTFHKWIPHEQVQSILSRSHVLSFPSIREFGGGVVLEAMALGVTPVVVDYGGPGELVEGGYGIAIPLGTRAQIIAHLSRALADIVADPERTCLPPDVLIRHVENEFSWQAKARKICQVYSDLMSSKARKNESLRNRI